MGNSSDEIGAEKHFFDLRKEGKIYVSKLFHFSAEGPALRTVRIMFENAEETVFGALLGGMQIRVSPKGKNQVSAVVYQDNKNVQRLTLTHFRERRGVLEPVQKDEFTFRSDEFERLVEFLKSINFIDFSNPENFQIDNVPARGVALLRRRCPDGLELVMHPALPRA